MPKCHVCGGTEFVKEEGFLYCSECQTRCKGVSEQVFDEWGGGAQHESRTRISQQQKTSTDEDNWTTWEAYNYVLKGMVDELIQLGASPNLYIVVFQLWARYLRKINVAFLDTNRKLPKLGPSYNERDARVLYSWPTKSELKKKKSRSNVPTVNSDSSHITTARARAKAKRALARSLHDKESLCSDMDRTSDQQTSDQLSTSSAVTGTTSSKPFFRRKNKYMTEEAVDFARRVRDRDSALKNEPWKRKVRLKPTKTSFLSKVKLLAIIYLGLLLCNDDIQLSDLLRWIREGHLSYCSVIHFLPSKMVSKGKCMKGLEFKHVWPSHLTVRQVAGNLVTQLQIKSLPTPSLPSLIQRYAKELELPGDLAEFAVHLWVDCPPKMPLKCEVEYEKMIFVNKTCSSIGKEVPNYEGRAMAFLLFAIKLLFALDGYTETILSTFADKANKILCLSDDTSLSYHKEPSNIPCKLFVWQDWVNYIEFRNSLISRWHYPMHAAQEPGLFQLHHEKKNVIPATPPTQNAMQYLGFCHYAIERKIMEKDKRKEPKWMEFMKSHLQDLTEMYAVPDCNIQNFQPSKTPCHSYMNELLKENINQWKKVDETAEYGPCNRLLNAKFCLSSIDYILKPEAIITALLQKNVNVDMLKCSAMGGKGSEFVKYHEPVSSHSMGKNKTNEMWTVEVTSGNAEKRKKLDWLAANDRNQLLNQIKTIESDLLEVKPKNNKLKSALRKRKSVEIKHRSDKIVTRLSTSRKKSCDGIQRLLLLLPYRQFWMFYGAFHEVTEEKFSDLCSRMPSSFSWLLHLCANVLEMSEMSLYNELVNVELVHKFIKHHYGFNTQKKRYECLRTNLALSTW